MQKGELMLDVSHLDARVRERIQVDANGCWRWTGGQNGQGYGRSYLPGSKPARAAAAHRLVYQELVGPIPDGFELDHLCRVRDCVNPQHLEVVTRLENIRRGDAPSVRAARMGICQRGHASGWYERPNGTKYCQECRREGDRRRDAAARAQRVDLLERARRRLADMVTDGSFPQDEREAIETAILGQPQKWGAA